MFALKSFFSQVEEKFMKLETLNFDDEKSCKQAVLSVQVEVAPGEQEDGTFLLD